MKGGIKNMKKITVGVLAFSIIAMLGIGLIAANPFGFGKGTISQELTEEEQTEMQEFHDSIQEAIEDNDYTAWKSLMESQLTQENFNALVERHATMQEQRAEREAYCEENECPNFEEGMGPKNGKGNNGRGSGMGMPYGQGKMKGDCALAEASSE